MLFFKYVPRPIRSRLIKLAGFLSIPGIKYTSEFYYWHEQLEKEGGTFQNGWYRNLMLNIAGETDENFVSEKIVADFGCGPRGSLCWAIGSKERIGIDVLAGKYQLLGIDRQNMRYVQSSEDAIPLETDSVDVLFTINAMDHVDNFENMCNEIVRILKPDGEFIGSFNLEEAVSTCEPQTLTEDKIQQSFLRHFTIQSYRMAKRGPKKNCYQHFNDGSDAPTEGPRYLWVRARKCHNS